jgi:hypothetical protein
MNNKEAKNFIKQHPKLFAGENAKLAHVAMVKTAILWTSFESLMS